ncbi:ABC transporter permease [Sphingobacterium thalpophilum]|uniref:ABC transporter permease n=1 Tax=Sphingobacterium thalpophilum TaxID=259 RepID=UPI0024A71E33|nr:iron chelate uptake ABC transporter family permease subunit [Sphingobacterium thalpophilum]
MRWSLLLCCLILFAAVSVLLGVERLDLASLFHPGAGNRDVLWISRIPRTITLILTGAGLPICGVILQQLTQNKFISPTTAGTLDAAKLGVLFGLLFFPQSGLLTKLIFGMFFCFSLTALFTFSMIPVVKRSTVLIPVFGVMYGYILNAVANVIGVQFNIVQNMESWMVGNFAKTLKGQYEVIYILLPLFAVCYCYANRFTIVGLGRDFTASIGVNYMAVTCVGLMLTSIMVSITLLTVGSIPFIDLVIPNLVSLIHGDNLRKNLPYMACYGAITLVVCDIMGRVVIYPYEIPCSMIVGSLGALLFLFILIRKGR